MARQSVGGTRMHVILTKVQEDRLAKLAKKTGMTKAEHLRRAVDVYFRVLDAAEKRSAA